MTDRAALLMDLAERVAARCIPEPNSGCFLWEGACNDKGYGQIWHQGRIHYTHRAALEGRVGILPRGILACHRCDNPTCCNPDHLFAGSARDNARDMASKRRHPICHDAQHQRRIASMGGKKTAGRNLSRHGVSVAAKVTAQQVIAIRADSRPDHLIAADYGIARSTVAGIQCRHTWKDVQ